MKWPKRDKMPLAIQNLQILTLQIGRSKKTHSLLSLKLLNNQTKEWHDLIHPIPYLSLLFHYKPSPLTFHKSLKHSLTNSNTRVISLDHCLPMLTFQYRHSPRCAICSMWATGNAVYASSFTCIRVSLMV